MNLWKVFGCSVMTAGLVVSVAWAADPAPAKDAKKAPKPAKVEAADGPRYPKQFNKLASLSDEQKKKLQSIAEKAVADKAAVDARAKQDYLGVLNDQQRTQLLAIEQGGAGKKAAKKGDVKPDAKPAAAKPDKK